MKSVAFLCDDIRQNTTCEDSEKMENMQDVFSSILEDIRSICRVDNINMNCGIYSNIEPTDNLIVLDFEVLFEGESFNINLHKQTYSIEDTHLDTLETLIKSNEDNEKLYRFKIFIKNILKKYFKEIHITIDDENELLCTELYLKIHKVENSFRSAINN